MGLHANLVPRDSQPISCQVLFDRLIAAGMSRHPNAFELDSEQEREVWRFTLLSDHLGVVSIEESLDRLAKVEAEARIPGTTDAGTIFNWAHHLWRIAQQADCDVFLGDPRAIVVLSSYLERDANEHLRLVKQPPLRELTDGSKEREIALHNAQNRYPIDDLRQAISDLQHKRQSIFDLPPLPLAKYSALAEENPEHPLAWHHRSLRQKAADFFKLLAVARPDAISEEILSELHVSLFDRDPAVRMAVAETLGELQQPMSVTHLKRLIEEEDESDWVRNVARKSLADCDLFR